MSGTLARWSYGTTGPVYAPSTALPPDKATSATLTEFFLMTPDRVFSDTGGTTLATQGGPVGRIAGQTTRTETAQAGGNANRGTYAIEPVSGLPAVFINGNTTSGQYQFYYRSNTAAPDGTVIMMYALQKSTLNRAQQFLSQKVGSTAGDQFFAFFAQTNYPDIMISGYTDTSGGFQNAYCNPQIGAPDVIGYRTDTTTVTEMWRGNTKVCSTVPTHTVQANTGTQIATLGSGVQTSGSPLTGSAAAAYLMGFITYSSALSATEMAGVMQWCQNYIHQPVPQGRYIGIYFAADGADENSGSSAYHMVQSDDLINWIQRPCFGLARGVTGPGTGALTRDMGVVSDALGHVYLLQTTYKYGSDTSYAVFDIHVCTDRYTLTWFKTVVCDGSGSAISTAPSSAALWAPEFVKNKDGSMYLDSNGLPIVVFGYSTDAGFDFHAYYIQPLDTTWTTGGNWGVAHAITWNTTPADIIDLSCVYTGGSFYLFGATRTGSGPNSTISYGVSTTINGTFTINSLSALGSTWEGPQPIWRASDNTWILHLDKQGLGYYYSQATAITGTYSTPALINTSFYPEQGNMIPLPLGW